jgi:hypothetical protein
MIVELGERETFSVAIELFFLLLVSHLRTLQAPVELSKLEPPNIEAPSALRIDCD